MTKCISRCLLCFALLVCAGCRLLTGLDNGSCPGTYGSRYGCVRVVVVIDAPPRPWPERYLFDLRAVPARERTGLDLNLGASPNTGENRLHLARHGQSYRATGDTASVWLSATIFENPPEYPVGVRLPVFAADSMLYLAEFDRARVDTVRLTLRRPDADLHPRTSLSRSRVLTPARSRSRFTRRDAVFDGLGTRTVNLTTSCSSLARSDAPALGTAIRDYGGNTTSTLRGSRGTGCFPGSDVQGDT
jgi:hypothetical protein